MLRLRFLLGFSLLSLMLICPSSKALADQQLETLAVGYSSLAGHHTPMWIAVEDRIGRKYGIDLKAIYAGRLRPQQLLMSGDVPIVVATGSGALTSHVLGSKDQVIVAINMTKVAVEFLRKTRSAAPRICVAKRSAFRAPAPFPRSFCATCCAPN